MIYKYYKKIKIKDKIILILNKKTNKKNKTLEVYGKIKKKRYFNKNFKISIEIKCGNKNVYKNYDFLNPNLLDFKIIK